MSFEVHREPLYRRYHTTLFSAGCCYAIVFGFLLIFIPLIISYNSGGFWLKEAIVYEQPTVQYRYQTILQLYGTSGSGKEPLNLYYSTSNTLNKLYADNVRSPVFNSAEIDSNFDGKTDRIEINIKMPTMAGEHITGMSMLVYCNVVLDTKAKMYFDAVSYVNYESGSPMSKLTVDGDLVLRQTWPLNTKGTYQTPYKGDELLDIADPDVSVTNAEDVAISTILKKNSDRNFTMVFRPTYEYVDQRALMSSALDVSTVPYFQAAVTIRVPEQPIWYTPSVTQVLKFAWIQYMSIFILVSFLLFRLNSFVFSHQLVSSYPAADVVYEKMD